MESEAPDVSEDRNYLFLVILIFHNLEDASAD